MTINPDFVLAPFHELLGNCQNNVLMGLRLVEKIETFPEPTPEELQFFQLSMDGNVTDILHSRALFKKWVLGNGFEEIHKCIRVTLDRIFIYKTIKNKLMAGDTINIAEFEKELHIEASNLFYDQLVKKINSLFTEPLQYQKLIESFNNARNCLVHTNGIVTRRHCNNAEKDKLIIYGNRFKYFFKKGEEETVAEIGKTRPENASLMLGAEEFQLEFSIGQEIELDLKQFLDILNTCVFFRADIEDKLKKIVDI